MITQYGAFHGMVCTFEACGSPSAEIVVRSTGFDVSPEYFWSDPSALCSGMFYVLFCSTAYLDLH